MRNILAGILFIQQHALSMIFSGGQCTCFI